MDLQKRKQVRLANYDYSQNGAYHVIVCTYQRAKLLAYVTEEGTDSSPKIALTELGEEVNSAIKFIESKYRTIYIDKYVIMPDHVHLLIRYDFSVDEKMAGGHGDPPLPDIIGRFKSYTTGKYGKVLWQRSFFEHGIRNYQDYADTWHYIENNPRKLCNIMLGEGE